MSSYFVIYFTQGEEWIKGKPMWEQDLRSHQEYGISCGNTGKAITGEPFADSSGGMVISKVQDMEEAKSLVDGDPAVIEKKLHPEIHPWLPYKVNFQLA